MIRSVPEPDVAVVPGRHTDYVRAHPTTALLVVEVSDSSLAQDRLTKTAIYATAGVPEYWIVNLRDDVVEVHRAPDPSTRRYAERRVVARTERIELVAVPGVSIAAGEIIPPH
jgi:Uma2 family endonuclease